MSDPYEHEVVREERREPVTHAEEPATATHVATSSYSVVRPAYNYRAVQVVWFVVSLGVALLTVRFVLKLLAASPEADFVRFIYGITLPLIVPFQGIFNTPSGRGGFVLEPGSLVAMVVYLLIGWGIVEVIKIITSSRGPHQHVS